MGVYQFVTMPKEQFPDIVIPTIYIQTINVGNSPKDMENLVTQPIEKQIKGITGVKINKVTSTSVQDFSAILPPKVVARLSDALGKVAANPEFQKKMNDLLLGVRYLDTAQFKTFFADTDKVTLDLIRKLGLQVSGPNAPKK